MTIVPTIKQRLSNEDTEVLKKDRREPKRRIPNADFRGSAAKALRDRELDFFCKQLQLRFPSAQGLRSLCQTHRSSLLGVENARQRARLAAATAATTTPTKNADALKV